MGIPSRKLKYVYLAQGDRIVDAVSMKHTVRALRGNCKRFSERHINTVKTSLKTQTAAHPCGDSVVTEAQLEARNIRGLIEHLAQSCSVLRQTAVCTK